MSIFSFFEVHRRAETDAQQQRALAAFGEAIATVAHSHLMTIANVGGLLCFDKSRSFASYETALGKKRWVIYPPQWDGRRSALREIESPHPADAAAEVVSMMIEEHSQ